MTTTPPEYDIVSATRVACDGGEGALGHPRVYLTIPADKGYVVCPYCDKVYIHESRSEEVMALLGLSAA